MRPELDQVGEAGAVFLDVGQDAFAPLAQVRGRDAVERQFEQAGIEVFLGHERRGDAGFFRDVPEDRLPVAATV